MISNKWAVVLLGALIVQSYLLSEGISDISNDIYRLEHMINVLSDQLSGK